MANLWIKFFVIFAFLYQGLLNNSGGYLSEGIHIHFFWVTGGVGGGGLPGGVDMDT